MSILNINITHEIPSDVLTDDSLIIYYVGYFVGTSFHLVCKTKDYKKAEGIVEQEAYINKRNLFIFKLYSTLKIISYHESV